jgi:short-chain fatty acids transporter
MLVASSYIGFMIWHAGLSGSIPLTLATPGSWTYDIVGGLIPVTETMLSPLNITMAIFFFITLPFVVRFMLPPPSRVREIDPALLVETEVVVKRPDNPTTAERLEHSRVCSTLLGLIFVIWLVQHFAANGLAGLNLDTVNLSFFAAGLLLVKSPVEYVKRAGIAAGGVGNLMVQFPLYAGIMGMSVASGLAVVFSNFFISLAGPETLPNLIHLSSSTLNMFIPSAGGKWAVEAPIYIPAAQALGANINHVAVAALWGDGLTNMIQPFWALPMLAIAKLGIRDIMGYCIVACIYGLILQQAFIYLFSVIS